MGLKDPILSALLEQSAALQFAVASGLPVQRMYSASETAMYLGVTTRTLNKEVRAGRLKPFTPCGTKYRCFDVKEVDRWIEESAR